MKKGFTLAEVLIALAIIGVVAALTIPSILSHNQQMEFKTGLRKAVSVLNSAIQANIAYEAETPLDVYSLYEYLMKHMSVTKTMSYGTCHGANGEFVSSRQEDGSFLDCSEMGAGFENNKVFYTTDGMRFEFPGTRIDYSSHYFLHESGIDAAQPKKGKMQGWDGWYDSNSVSGFCGSDGLAKNSTSDKNTPCIILVDVNGDRKPNPPQPYEGTYKKTMEANGSSYEVTRQANQTFVYSYVKPDSKKVNDIFSIMITDKEAIPFGVVAQRAMYKK